MRFAYADPPYFGLAKGVGKAFQEYLTANEDRQLVLIP